MHFNKNILNTILLVKIFYTNMVKQTEISGVVLNNLEYYNYSWLISIEKNLD